MSKDKILIDRKVLESLNKTFQQMKEYLERTDSDFYQLTVDANKGLNKALRYFNNRNPELHCDPDEVSCTLTAFLPGESLAMITDCINNFPITVENDEDVILEINAPQSAEELKHILKLMADPKNYCYYTLNPDFFSDYNFVEIFDEWKNDYVLPSEFERVVDLIIDDQKMILSETPMEESPQLIVYPRG